MITDAPPAGAVPEADVVLRDGSTAARATRDARGRAAPARLPRLALGGVALVPLLQRGRQPRPCRPQRRRRPTACRCSPSSGPEGTVVGHGTYRRRRTGAEVAFAVADAWQGHGIATVLLAHLAHAASVGRHRDVHGDRPALEPPHAPGLPRLGLPGVDAARRTTAWRSSSRPRCRARRGERFEERQRVADVAAVAHVLRPASVAVIGASRRPGTVGGEVVRNLLGGGLLRPAAPRQRAGRRGRRPADRPLDRRRRGRRRARRSSPCPAAAVIETARAVRGPRACARSSS